MRQAGFALRQAPDREGRRGEERGDDDAKAKRDSPARKERGDDDAKAKHDSPARKRRISGSGDDEA